jgi:hypothetical protein
LLFVLFHVLFVHKCVLLPGDNPIAVNKYIVSYQYNINIKTASISWHNLDAFFQLKSTLYRQSNVFIAPLLAAASYCYYLYYLCF